MIVPDEQFVASQRRNAMKKLMTLMLALSFLSATVAVTFAQDDTKKDTTKKKKGKKKKTDESKTAVR
jgi:hypothetical protein